MPKLIVKCPYIKPNASRSLSGYVQYIATREGVERVRSEKQFLEATKKQKNIADELIRRYPDSKELAEYEDYIRNPTQRNAEDLICRITDAHAELLMSRDSYVDYIATRPRVEMLGHHGLFSDEGSVISLSAAAKEVGEHPGNVWTHIISLKREDAERLGYDNADAWMTLLRSQRNVIASCMKIKPENFRWYAAFHNESNHPHVHMIAYSVDPHEAFLSRKGIDRMRSSLAQEIFRNDLMFAYEQQTINRDKLRQRAKKLLEEIVERIKAGAVSDPLLEQQIILLAGKLAEVSGRKVYGYLQPELKQLVNNIVDRLAKDKSISELYDLWYEQRYEIIRTYTDTLPPKCPLSENREFKPVKNAVIQAALELLNTEEYKSSRNVAPEHLASAVISLLDSISRILDDKISYNDRVLSKTDSKERRRIAEKMAAHGQKMGG